MGIVKSVTVDDVMAWKLCSRYGLEEVKKLFGRKRKATALDILGARIPVDDRFWCILRHGFLSDTALRLFAADCAEHVLHLFEKKSPKDDRPRNATQAAKDFAAGKIGADELADASDAASASASAAYAAASYASASAAYAADAASASAAACAAYAAADYAAAAAYDAADYAAKERSWQVKRLRRYLMESPK